MNRFSAKCFIVGSAAWVTASTPAINIRHDVDDSKYKDLAAKKQFDPVGMFTGGPIGSGTYIGFGNDAHWVLTAGHVARAIDFKETVVQTGDKKWKLDSWVSKGDKDLAVVKIKDMKAGDAKAARFLNVKIGIHDKLADRTFGTAVGYGKSGTGKNPSGIESGTKRAMQNRIDALDPATYNKKGEVIKQYSGYATDFDGGVGKQNTLDKDDWSHTRFGSIRTTSEREQTGLEGGIDRGDSGGALFVEMNKMWLLAGVTQASLDWPGNEGYGEWSFFEALDKKNGDGVKSKTGISPVPEPATGLLFLGAFALPRKRKISERA